MKEGPPLFLALVISDLFKQILFVLTTASIFQFNFGTELSNLVSDFTTLRMWFPNRTALTSDARYTWGVF